MKRKFSLSCLVIVCLALGACGGASSEAESISSSVKEESLTSESSEQSASSSSEEADTSSASSPAASSVSAEEDDTGISELGSIIKVTSQADGFSIRCSDAYLTTEGEDGALTIFLLREPDTFPFVEVDRIEKTTAKKYLAARKKELTAEYGEELLSCEDPEPLDTDGRDMYSADATIRVDGETLLVSHFAESRDGDVFSYRAVYLAEDADAVTEALHLAISSLDTGDGDTAEASAESEALPEVREKTEETGEIAGWTYELAKLDNGDIEYRFNDVLAVDLPASWDGKYEMDASTEHTVTFYHKKSREAWEKDGKENAGKLFSVSFSPNEDYKNLPSYRDLGPAEGGYYFFIFPTEEEGYADNGPIMEEYEELLMDMNYVEENSYSLLVP